MPRGMPLAPTRTTASPHVEQAAAFTTLGMECLTPIRRCHKAPLLPVIISCCYPRQVESRCGHGGGSSEGVPTPAAAAGEDAPSIRVAPTARGEAHHDAATAGGGEMVGTSYLRAYRAVRRYGEDQQMLRRFARCHPGSVGSTALHLLRLHRQRNELDHARRQIPRWRVLHRVGMTARGQSLRIQLYLARLKVRGMMAVSDALVVLFVLFALFFISETAAVLKIVAYRSQWKDYFANSMLDVVAQLEMAARAAAAANCNDESPPGGNRQ